MQPSDWISLGALAVAALSLLTGALVAPRIAAAIDRSHRIRDERAAVYVDAVRLLRARQEGVEQAALGWTANELRPVDDDAAQITARLLLVASEAVWLKVEDFFKVYWSAALDWMKVDNARLRGGGDPDIQAQMSLGAITERLQVITNDAIDLMRKDLGTGAMSNVLRNSRSTP